MAACPFLIEGVLHTTLKSLFQGVHYYRYPDSFPAVLWASDIAAAAYAALGHLPKTGALGDHLFEHIQGGPSGLFPKFAKSALTPLPASEVFWQLGMVNACQYYTFEANEAIADFQKSVRCYKRLAQTNIVNYDYDVARKYLHALEHTLFYRGWARKTLAMLKDETSIDSDPDYSLAMDFLLCYELLDKNLNNFWYYLQNYKDGHLPRYYQEGVMMLWIDNGMSLQNLLVPRPLQLISAHFSQIEERISIFAYTLMCA